MRITNRCKADFDRGFARTVNSATGGRIDEVVIRKIHFKEDQDFRACFEPIKEGRFMKITIIARSGEDRQSMRELFAHEIGEMLLACHENEIVIDGYARNLVDAYKGLKG